MELVLEQREPRNELGEQFSQIALGEILRAPLVKGVQDFLEKNHTQYHFFIASGTPQEELSYIVRQRGLTSFFQGVYGAPATKSEIINKIQIEQNLSREEIAFIGDAESDKLAAKETGIAFIARTKPNDTTLHECIWKIHDFTKIETILVDMQIEP